MHSTYEISAEIQDLREHHRILTANHAMSEEGSGYRLDLARRLALLESRIPAAEKAAQVAERANTPHAIAMARRAVIAAWKVTDTLGD